MALISPNNLCKCWKKPARDSDIFHHRWQLVYNLTLTTWRKLSVQSSQRSLFETISLTKEFNFDIK